LLGSGAVTVAGLPLGLQPLAIVIVGSLLVAGLWILLERTQIGRRMRAVASDRHMARAVGIPVGRYVTLSLALAGALAGIAGFLLGHQFLVTPTQGAGHMLKAYIAVALGGWGSVPGALVGALAIGFFETFVSAELGDAWASAALYIAVLLVLTVRPRGLFGEPLGQRA
jgi:branched-chain amino acid transport system permease protein